MIFNWPHDLPKITAIVVCRNEATKLSLCLKSLAWCDQRIVVDLGSHDRSYDVAREHADIVLTHPFTPIVEPARVMAASYSRNDWLLMVDPDEQFPEGLVSDIAAMLRTPSGAAAGAIRLPWQFYFKGKRLDGTVWGGPNRFKRFLVHRQRCNLQPLSHRQVMIHTGDELTITPTELNHVHHDWSDSYLSLIERHLRYISREGEGLFASGERFSVRRLLVEPINGFKRSIIDFAGWRLGFRGLILSSIYATWLAGSALSLFVHQIRVKKTTPPIPQQPKNNLKIQCLLTDAPAGKPIPFFSSPRNNTKRCSRHEKPRITIITPSFNQGEFLEKTIQSVLEQNYPNLEYFVIDGGSRDNSVEIIRRYERHLAGWISEPDRGQVDAINKGLAAATGDIIAFINSDDVYLPGTLCHVANQMADSRIRWLVGDYLTIDADGCPQECIHPRQPESFTRYLMHTSGFIPQPSSFWSSVLFDQHGWFDPSLHFCFDYEFNCRLLAAGEAPAVISGALAAFRLHPASKGCSQPLSFGLERLEVARRYEHHLPLRERIALKRNIAYRARRYAIELSRRPDGSPLWPLVARRPWWLASSEIRTALFDKSSLPEAA